MEDKREKEAISKVSELKVLSSRFKSKDDRSKNKKKSRKEVAKEEQEKKRFELEEVTLKKDRPTDIFHRQMMQKTLKKSKKENAEKIKSYIVTENGLGKFLKVYSYNFAKSTEVLLQNMKI